MKYQILSRQKEQLWIDQNLSLIHICALQNDGFVNKISDYISKKVADKLTGMCKTDRESYEKYWDDISPFIKFGFIRDQKFADKIKDYILFKNRLFVKNPYAGPC